MAPADDPLSPYVPRLVRRWLLETPDATHQVVDGSLTFVDISGFTRLSERLAKNGRVGAEELTDAIGSCFTALLRIAYERGATLLKFGGDALLLLYTGDQHAARACAAAVGMRRELADVGRIDSSAGRVRLRMSIGIHSGAVDLFLVGDSHRELIITGPAATETVRMEGAADAGQILVSTATAAAVPDASVSEPSGPGLLLRPRVPAPAPSVEPGTAYLEADVLGAIPPALREHALAHDVEPEHRRVTIAFVKFTGVDPLLSASGPSAVAAALDGLVRIVQGAADRHGVTFLGTDIDAGGGKIILVTGAPASGGNDEERMLLALRDVASIEHQLPLKIGVNAGHVFAGDIGPPYRRAYTVMGDAVNLAARVMGKAEPGTVVATPDVLDSSRTTFRTTELEPFLVKGKSAPVAASVVHEVDATRELDAAAELPFVGREHELAAFDAVVDAAIEEGHGRLVEVVGEAGIGKSRLLGAFATRADGRIETHTFRCELHHAATPYASSRRLLRDLLDIDQQADPEDAGRALCGILGEHLPELLPWAPLLAVPLGGRLPATAETRALDPQYRRTRLNALVAELLSWRWSGPALLIGEDVQWMDEPSADIVRSLTTRLDRHPWVLCTSRREQDEALGTPGSTTVVLPLSPLDGAAAGVLAAAATESSPLPAHQMAQLVERSGGNPLFLQELVTAALEAGGVDQLPDSVETLVTARIDRLPRHERTVLRHVSVLGQRFPRELAEAVLPDVEADDRVWRRLRDFLVEDGHDLQFRHGLIRDVAYAGLRFRLRRDLHAAAGDVIAQVRGPSAPETAGLLSFHFFHAQRYREAWHHSLRAAEQARVVHAHVDAARFLERAIQAARGIGDLPTVALADVHERLGDVRSLVGAYDGAVVAYRTARRLTPPEAVVDEARLILRQAEQLGWLNSYAQALRWIRRALKRLDALAGEEAGRQRAELCVWYARFCEEGGRHRLALRWCQRAVDAAEAVDDRSVLAHAYRIAGRAHGNLGRPEAVTDFERALGLYEELEDLPGQGAMTNNLGAFAYWEGRWPVAREHFRRSLEISEQIGDEEGVAVARYNLGHLLTDQGRLEEAAELLDSALRSSRAAGHRDTVATAQRDLARILARSGKLDEANRLLAAAHATFEAVGAKVDEIDTLATVAETLLLDGKPAEAMAVIDDAMDLNATLGGVSAQTPMLHRLRGYALLRTGATEAAGRSFEESLGAGRQREMNYEVGLTLRALAEAVADDDPSRSQELLSESRLLLDELGVERVPTIPPAAEEVPTAGGASELNGT